MSVSSKIPKNIINGNRYLFIAPPRIIKSKLLLNCLPTYARINKSTYDINLIHIDKKCKNYYNYTKQFDGSLDKTINNKVILYNFINTNNLQNNIVIENNYTFIEYQLKNLNKSDQYIYINMFWGPYYNYYNNYFEFLYNNSKSKFKNQCFIGELECVNHWLSNYKKNNNL